MVARVSEGKPEDVRMAAEKARNRLARNGFAIQGKIRVRVDPHLAFMGYTHQSNGVHIIVVSGRAVSSGVLEGLLVHEMSHIYRTESRHPSHDKGVISEVMEEAIEEHGVKEDYQLRILWELINHFQNIYADDIAFTVFSEEDTPFSRKQIQEFFLGWIKTDPIYTDGAQAKWLNGAIMVSNAFAVGSLKRHGHLDGIEHEIKAANAQFLEKLEVAIAEKFDYFKNFFAKLDRNPDKFTVKKELSSLIRNFLNIVKPENSGQRKLGR